MLELLLVCFYNYHKIFQIAAEVSAPLAKTDEIVIVGDDRSTSEVTRLLASLTPSVHALTGVDVTKVGLSAFFIWWCYVFGWCCTPWIMKDLSSSQTCSGSNYIHDKDESYWWW